MNMNISTYPKLPRALKLVGYLALAWDSLSVCFGWVGESRGIIINDIGGE